MGTMLPNAVSSYDASVDGAALPQIQIDRIKSGAAIMVLAGRIDYQDAYGNQYWTEICLLYLVKENAFGDCSTGTDIR
jgi:hypothetical protein